MHLQQEKVEVFQLDLQTWTGRGGRGVSLVLGVMFLWVLMKAQLSLRVCVVTDISGRLAHVCVCVCVFEYLPRLHGKGPAANR